MKIEEVEVFGIAMPMIGEYKNAYLTKTVQRRRRPERSGR